MKIFKPDFCNSHLLNTAEDFISNYLDIKSSIQHSFISLPPMKAILTLIVTKAKEC